MPIVITRPSSAGKKYTLTTVFNKGQLVNGSSQPDYLNASLSDNDKTTILPFNNGDSVRLRKVRARVHGNLASGGNIEIYRVVDNGSPSLIGTLILGSNSKYVNQDFNQLMVLASTINSRLECNLKPNFTDNNLALEIQADFET